MFKNLSDPDSPGVFHFSDKKGGSCSGSDSLKNFNIHMNMHVQKFR